MERGVDMDLGDGAEVSDAKEYAERGALHAPHSADCPIACDAEIKIPWNAECNLWRDGVV